MIDFVLIFIFLAILATTAMITPITEAVVLELFKRKRHATNVSAIAAVTALPTGVGGSSTGGTTGTGGHYLKASATKSARSSYAMSSLSLNPLLLNNDSSGSISEREMENGRSGYENLAMEEKSGGVNGVAVAHGVGVNGEETRNSEPFSIKDLNPEELRIAKGLVLCVAYAANIGGTVEFVLIDWLVDNWMHPWYIDWLIDWLFDWLIDGLIFYW